MFPSPEALASRKRPRVWQVYAVDRGYQQAGGTHLTGMHTCSIYF